MQLHQNQAIIASDRHRFRVLDAGRRFGKTVLAVEEIKGKAIYTVSKICYISPTYQQSRDIAWEMLKKEMSPVTIQVNESRLELRVRNIHKKESLIALRGWESVETLRGQRFDFLVIDEVASMRNFWTGWQEVLRPTLTDTRGEVLFISTPLGFNHFYDLFNLEKKDIDFKSFNFTSYDNPFIPKDELDKAKQELTENRFAQEYLADFRKTEGLVYKEFDREKHTYSTLPEIRWVKKLSGLDFGWTNPTASILCYKSTDNDYYIESEFYKTEQSVKNIIKQMNDWKSDEIYPDPEAPEKIRELIEAGLFTMKVHKGKDSVVAGIAKVQALFKNNKIKINKHCENLIWELETYRYPDKKTEHNTPEEPIKENDHLCDAVRYMIISDMENVQTKPVDTNWESISKYEPSHIQQKESIMNLPVQPIIETNNYTSSSLYEN